jgi:tRNA U55 pseudouridine synthase TruB
MSYMIDKSDLLENFNGIILINKSPGTISYDVVRSIKRVFFLKKSVMPEHWIQLQKACLSY